MGRPSLYTPELAASILERLATGESLRAICKPEVMPAASTICLWALSDKVFAEHYARARESQADALAEEILEIADDSSRDFRTIMRDGVETEVFDTEHVQRSKLRVDSRKWFASKVAPKRYGEKLELAGDPSAPLVPILNVSIRKD